MTKQTPVTVVVRRNVRQEYVSSFQEMVESFVPISQDFDGKTVGGLTLYPDANRQDRLQALKLYTAGSAWFSGEEDRKGTLAPGSFADFAVLSDDYFTVPDEMIRSLQSVLTVVGGNIVYGGGEFTALAPEPIQPMPDWSPVGIYGGGNNATNDSTYLASGSALSSAGSELRALSSKSRRESTLCNPGCACWAF